LHHKSVYPKQVKQIRSRTRNPSTIYNEKQLLYPHFQKLGTSARVETNIATKMMMEKFRHIEKGKFTSLPDMKG